MTPSLLLALSALGHSSLLQSPDALALATLRQDKAVAQKQEEKKQEEKKDPYQEAIKDFAKKDGVFTVFQKDDTVLLQIPKSMMGRDFLWTTELKETPSGMYNGTFAGNGVVRFEMRGEKVLVRTIDYSVRATEGDEIKVAVDQSNVNPIMKTFTPKAKAPDGSPLLDVTSFFKGDIPEFSVKGMLGGAMVDGERSFIDNVKVFPQNLNVQITQTVTGGGAGGGRGRSPFGGAPSRNSNTGTVLHSIVLLPEKPMQGRLADSRVGYFSTGYTDYGTDTHGTKEYAFIDRYRLEKKDPNAEVSEPVKPIVYYISRECPARWHKYIKQGIEDWQPAFEAAGFKNAIVCKPAPSVKEDPNWDPEDVRYSVIRWAPLPIENAMGPHVSDPRSGEIISAHVIMWHDILKLQTAWYFAQASATDPRAQKMPMPDDLMGECLRFVVAHEVGHTLGLPHNGKSSGMIPVKLLRDPAWTKENGTCTSIMDYARFNYVAQPGDGAALTPKVGKYDKFSIMWGYKPIEARNPGDEKRTLDLWASKQVTDPMLRFYDNFDFDDPTALMESLGDNTVEASTLGVANLKRTMGFLLPASTKFGEDYSELAYMHSAVMDQMTMYIFHVATAIGGMIGTDYHAGRGGEVFVPVSKDYQKSAVKWLCDNVLEPPTWIAPRTVMLRLGKDTQGPLTRLQSMAIGSLLNEAKWNRMWQNEAMNGASAYTVSQLLGDVRSSLFREMATGGAVGLNRRNVQRTYIRMLCQKMASTSEPRMHASVELRNVLKLVNTAQPRTKDVMTLAHLDELKRQIEFSLANPDKVVSAGGGVAALPFLKPWCTIGLDLEKMQKALSGGQ